MKTILVATDFSSSAKNALNYAVGMALSIKASIYLLHVYPIPGSYSEMPLEINIEDLKQSAEQELAKLKYDLTLRTNEKLSITTKVTIGSFYDELSTACEALKPYTVVMGCQGTTAAERFVFGGHSVYAMKHLQWPLITVPLSARYASIKKIALACEFKEDADSLPLDEITLMVNNFHAELHIVNTGKMGEFNLDLVFESGILQEKLKELKPVFHFLTVDNIDEGIITFANENAIDLLIVLPKRYRLPDILVHRSNTKQFVLHSHVPVLALHG
jgi:nucleotide-binding universal stress UspA family protein